MPVSVSIEPFSSSIDMYDSPDTCSAYSLSGHIVISVTPSSSLLGLSRPVSQNLLLTDLELTFEGQSELVLNDIGYAPLRLISLTRKLVSSAEPVPISADEERAEWRVVFDIAVPGWLPASSVFGDDEQHAAGVSYALFARARILNADPDDALSAPAVPISSVWNTLCAAVRLAPTRPRTVHAELVSIKLTRYASSPAEDAEIPRNAFAIQVADAASQTNIPADILRALQIHVVVPSRTAVHDPSLPLVLRMRAPVAGDTHLRVLGFEAEVIQVEHYHTSPSPSYRARFPLPPASEQPPAKALKAPHPVGTLFELGLVGLPSANGRITREHSLVPRGASKLFRVRGSDTTAHVQGVPLEDAWLRMEVAVPLSPHSTDKPPRPSGESPFLNVKHELRFRLSVGYDEVGEGERETSDELVFGVPLEFVRPAPAREMSSAFLSHAGRSTASLPLLPHPEMSARAPSPARSMGACVIGGNMSSRSSTPAPPALPAYNQLFHENGDRKEEMGTLPLYREKEEAESEEETSASASASSSSAFLPDSTSEASLPPSPVTPNSPVTPLSPLLPRTPPGLPVKRAHPRPRVPKYGESFLPFDEDEEEELLADSDENLEEDVQFGIAY